MEDTLFSFCLLVCFEGREGESYSLCLKEKTKTTEEEEEERKRERREDHVERRRKTKKEEGECLSGRSFFVSKKGRTRSSSLKVTLRTLGESAAEEEEEEERGLVLWGREEGAGQRRQKKEDEANFSVG